MGAGGHPAEHVAAAGRGVRLEHPGDRLEVRADRVKRALRDLQGHEGLDAEARGGEVDVRPVAGDHAGALEPGQPGGDGAPGDPGAAGELEIARAGVRAQRLEEVDVETVHGCAFCPAVIPFR